MDTFLYTLCRPYLGNNELLRTIDVRNCPLLSQAVDISGCRNIEHIYFEGTAITGLDLPKGGIIKTLHLPGTLTNLSVIGHSGITDFVLPSVENLSTCRLEHVGNGINTKAVVNSLPAGCRVRMIGFDWSVASETELTSLKAKLDTMRGLNENGGNEDRAQLLGTIHIGSITGAVLKAFKDMAAAFTTMVKHRSIQLRLIRAIISLPDGMFLQKTFREMSTAMLSSTISVRFISIFWMEILSVRFRIAKQQHWETMPSVDAPKSPRLVCRKLCLLVFMHLSIVAS